MNICRLNPEFVEPLSLALFEEWYDFAPWSSLDKIRAYYAQCINGDNLPLAFAVVVSGQNPCVLRAVHQWG